MSFGDAAGLKKFVTQDEVDEKRRQRQEEWEKVRKPDDPEECPEEPVDNRSLYDRLEEQRLKKEEEYEEKVAFRNQVRRLDEDEADFLDFVTETQQEVNKARNQEEKQLLSELKSCTIAIIVPDPDTLPGYAKDKLSLEGDMQSLCQNPEVKKAILEDITAIGKKAKLASFEQAKDIYLHPELFSVENGLLTPTFKAKRNELKVFFKSQIDNMYKSLD